MNESKWSKIVVASIAVCLMAIAGVTAFVDPFLHYHAPLSFLEYPLLDERYQNDGMARHYTYDAVITGTSMTQNFKCSEFDALWGTESIKTSYSGASFHEICRNLERYYRYQPQIRYVVCSLDGNRLNYPAFMDEYEGYPEYLYDQNIFNDTNYLLNKDVVPKTIAVINYTKAGNRTPDRDAYGRWSEYKTYGREEVFSSFEKLPISGEKVVLSESDIQVIRENISQNVENLVKTHPETEFYYFFPPYSICYWEALVRSGQLEAQIQMQEIACEILLPYQNVHLFDFSGRTDWIANLDNYMDTMHYGGWINSEMLIEMKAGEGELHAEDYETYYTEIVRLYTNYDYDE